MITFLSVFAALLFAYLVWFLRCKVGDEDDWANLTLADIFNLRGHLLFFLLVLAFIGWAVWSEY